MTKSSPLNKNQLTQSVLRELLDYNVHTGLLTWKHRAQHWFISYKAFRVWNGRYAGKPALSTPGSKNYLHGSLLNMNCQAHQVIWVWMTGEWPTEEIDHEDHNRGNNVWSNLRTATSQQNRRNMSIRHDNTSGVIGVRWDKRSGSWVASIDVGGSKTIWLGSFKDFDEAVVVRKQAERQLGYHLNHGN